MAAADDFYAGKTITVYIGSGAGGGYDFFGRLVARHLGRKLPGQPAMVAQNMPGAGSIKMFNYIYNVAPKDGTALGIGTPSITLIDALKTPGARFSAAKFNWIGRIADNITVTVAWHGSKVKTIQDAEKSDITIGAIAATSPLSLLPEMLSKVVGVRFKLITGYADSNGTMVAMERGEVEGTTVSWNTLKVSKQNWLRDKSVNILVQYVMTRHPDIGNVPTALELARTDEERQLIALYVSAADIGYSIAAPPGLPPERVTALREAFAAMQKTPAFIEDITRSKVDSDPLSGEKLQALIRDSGNVSPAVLQRARGINGASGGE
jgi:tripartite-type tricarboxylate transporter receptor subunit TctC